jgi:beta-glucosidase/6-phospho-beta-glucosidase/beta-galactosidase
MPQFMFATGIENSYPTIKGPDGARIRIDEMEKTHHYERWREDFRITKELGIPYLRYGPPLYKTHLGPGKYDWDFADETFHELERLGITPIADLCHFGVPDWLGDFRNPEFPEFFAEYAVAFARRYPWVKLVTPVNEMYVAAKKSGEQGTWNECEKSDQGFVTAVKHLCRANRLAMESIWKERDGDVTFIQSESSEYYHCEHPDVQHIADFHNERRFLTLDLNYGRPISAKMFRYLMEYGMTAEEYDWFADPKIRARRIMGNDYYEWNEHMVHADGSISGSAANFGYYVITHQYYSRYMLPVMHTETNVMNPEQAPQWLSKEWANVRRLREDGVPMLGFTWYSLTDQVDWDTGLRLNRGKVNPLGLVDLDRNIRPVGKAYQQLIKVWQSAMKSETYDVLFAE